MRSHKIIFSPTGGTERVADAIAETWAEPASLDLADRSAQFDISLDEDTLALIAMPSFGGVAPQLALDRLARVKANGAKCAVAAVYGNRAYDDTLIQMKDYAEQAGFKVIAAVAAVAEHSIIRAYAAGRPNDRDLAQLRGFGERIAQKACGEPTDVEVPGRRPYKGAGAKLVPKASSACTACGACAKACPAGAIDPQRPRATDKRACIGCMRCVSMCPAKARRVSAIMTAIAALVIKKACSAAKDNELFI